jgi:hypothetical protein
MLGDNVRIVADSSSLSLPIVPVKRSYCWEPARLTAEMRRKVVASSPPALLPNIPVEWWKKSPRQSESLQWTFEG